MYSASYEYVVLLIAIVGHFRQTLSVEKNSISDKTFISGSLGRTASLESSSVFNNITNRIGTPVLPPDIYSNKTTEQNSSNETSTENFKMFPNNRSDKEKDMTIRTITVSTEKWVLMVGFGTVIAVLGLAGNCLSVCVLASSKMTSSNSVILIFLAFFDSLILIRYILFITVQKILSVVITPFELYGMYVTPVNVIFRPFEFIGHFGSVYTTVLLSIERFVVVAFPMKAVFVCTPKFAKISGFLILVFSVVYNIPKFLLATLHIQKDPVTNLTKFVAVRRTFSSDMDFFFYHVYTKYMEVILLVALPGFLLVILNVVILWKLWQRSHHFKKSNSTAFQRKDTVRDRVTAMAMAIILTFCVTLILLRITRTLCLQWVQVNQKSKPQMCYTLAMVNNLVYTFNSSINVVYYYMFGSKFRMVLKSLCGRKKIDKNSLNLNKISSREISTSL